MRKRIVQCAGLCVFIACLSILGRQSSPVEPLLQEVQTENELSENAQNEIAFFSLRDTAEHRERTIDRNWNAEDFKRCLELLYAISEDKQTMADRYSLTVFYEDSTKLSESYYIGGDGAYAEICEEMLKPGWTAL